MPSSPTQETPSREHVWRMFDRIAPRYDLLNRLLSGRRDVAWRKALVKRLPEGAGLRVLDLATGTGDVLLAIAAAHSNLRQGVGVDISSGMLVLGREKVRKHSTGARLSLAQGDAMALAFPEAAFDLVSIAFGIRNVIDVDTALREMHRVLAPGGKALILEFSMPQTPGFKHLYLAYFRHLLPRIGGLLSGDYAAYQYLNKTVESFPYGEAFCQRMRAAGFEGVAAQPLTFGIATLYEGIKPQG